MHWEEQYNFNWKQISKLVVLTDLPSASPLNCFLEDLLTAASLNEAVDHLVIVPKLWSE
jgi:hypothetical protein